MYMTLPNVRLQLNVPLMLLIMPEQERQTYAFHQLTRVCVGGWEIRVLTEMGVPLTTYALQRGV